MRRRLAAEYMTSIAKQIANVDDSEADQDNDNKPPLKKKRKKIVRVPDLVPVHVR